MDWMMHEWDEHLHEWNMGGIAYAMGIVGIVLGIIIVAAVMLHINPTQHVLWGTLIIVFSVISVLRYNGGLGIGLILRIIGEYSLHFENQRKQSKLREAKVKLSAYLCSRKFRKLNYLSYVIIDKFQACQGDHYQNKSPKCWLLNSVNHFCL